MIEKIEQLDHELLLFINQMNSPVWDEIMWIISNKFIWFPIYLFLFVLVFRKTSVKEGVWFVVFFLLTVGLSDFIATHGFKETFERFRPSHHFVLGEMLHFYEFKPGEFYKGGQYGFVSGHATNSIAIALLFGFRLRNYFKYLFPILIFWALLVSYSRMYLGVHYPTDILGGLILGSIISSAMYYMYWRLILKPKIKQQE
ncbi:MAG: phosphatase PAP2 family protein [Brumimicrobium sp.]|nr:phosphatase PAP2 family protein [Brumimicrobium sp.]